jgi:hypothetical protein
MPQPTGFVATPGADAMGDRVAVGGNEKADHELRPVSATIAGVAEAFEGNGLGSSCHPSPRLHHSGLLRSEQVSQ